MQRNLIINLVLLLLVIIFAVQNYEPVPIKFYFWTVRVSTGLLVAAVFVAGVLIGLLTASFANKRKLKKIKEESKLKEKKPEAEPEAQKK